MKKKINIANFIGYLGSGGAERIAIEVSNYFNEKDYTSVLITVDENNKYYDYLLKTPMIKLKSKKLILSSFKLRKALIHSNVDVIFAHMTHEIIIAFVATLGTRIKVIGVEHNHDKEIKSRKPKIVSIVTLFLMKFIYPRLDTLVCVSSGLSDYFQKKYKSNSICIYNPVNIDSVDFKFNNPHKDLWRFAFVGRNVYQKNFDECIRFISSQISSTKNIVLNVYGTGYDSYNKSFNIKKNISVVFHGFVKDTKDIYGVNDFLLLTSRWEGFGNVVLEAGIHGCWPLVYDVDYGPREIVELTKFGTIITKSELIDDSTLTATYPREIPCLESFLTSKILESYEALIRNN